MNAHETCATHIISVNDFSPLITNAKNSNNLMASSTLSPAIARKCQSLKKKTELSVSMTTTTSATTTCSSTATTTVIDNTSCKDRFNTEILLSKNNSSNNPLFTPERYNETIELINNAKLKRYSDRSEKEICFLKAYDVINVGSEQKLV